MKRFFLIILLILISCINAYANPKEVIKTDGFVIPTNKWKDKIKIDENFEINNPEAVSYTHLTLPTSQYV